MKKYYNTLSKDKKNKIKEIYRNEYKNSNLNNSLIRLKIYAFIGFITSIVICIDFFINKNNKIYNIVIASILFIASIIFLIGSIILKQKELEKIALKNKTK